MKWVLFVVIFIVVVGGAVIAFLPMSVAADYLAGHEKQFRYKTASGSVWDGQLLAVKFGDQNIGDVSVRTDLFKLFSGRAEGTMGLKRTEYTGAGRVSYVFATRKVHLSDIKLAGQMAAVPGLPERIRQSGGKFTVDIKDLMLGERSCEAATGEVWTDALAKVDMEGKWTGPELRGPVTCRDGHLVVEATGKAVTGEDVLATVDVGGDLQLTMDARVTGASPGAAEVLSRVGFEAGNGQLELRKSLGGR
jgi:hypothetical protein